MTNVTLFQTILENFSNARLLCIGDVMVDHFIYGQVNRVSPEAPVPILRSMRQSTVLGGAGNVARNLSSLSAICYFCGVVGEDEDASEAQSLFDDLEGVKAYLICEKGRKTTVKTRYVCEGQQLLRVDDEDSYEINKKTERDILAQAKSLIQSVDVVIVSDYGKGLFTNDLLSSIMNEAKKHNKPVVVDPKRRDFSVYAGASLMTPNAKELQESSSFKITTDEDVEKATSLILKECEIKAVLATRGDKGMTLNEQGDIHHIPTQALEIYDVSGAGDTVVATLSAALAVDASMEAAAKIANTAAGLVVAKAGTATVTTDEIHKALTASVEQANTDKTMSWSEAQAQTIEWHRRGLKVGFANGCYDLLHPGHISLLNQAKKSCDRLIVALNSDDSVRRLKGPTRPLQNESSRTKVMAALSDVDLVVIFDQETPLELIQHLRPDVLIKGADYKVEDVVGAKEVFSWGGDVVLAELEEGHSTTNTISRVA